MLLLARREKVSLRVWQELRESQLVLLERDAAGPGLPLPEYSITKLPSGAFPRVSGTHSGSATL